MPDIFNTILNSLHWKQSKVTTKTFYSLQLFINHIEESFPVISWKLFSLNFREDENTLTLIVLAFLEHGHLKSSWLLFILVPKVIKQAWIPGIDLFDGFSNIPAITSTTTVFKLDCVLCRWYYLLFSNTSVPRHFNYY